MIHLTRSFVIIRKAGEYLPFNELKNNIRVTYTYTKDGGKTYESQEDEWYWEPFWYTWGSAGKYIYSLMFYPWKVGEYMQIFEVDHPLYRGVAYLDNDYYNRRTILARQIQIQADDLQIVAGTIPEFTCAAAKGYSESNEENMGLAGTDEISSATYTLYDENNTCVPEEEYSSLEPGTYSIVVSGARISTKGTNPLDMTDQYQIEYKKGILTVKEDIQPSFTVIIPSTASVNAGSMTIACKNLSDCTVGVTVTSQNNWQLQSESGKTVIGYQLLDANKDLVENGEIAANFRNNGGAFELKLALTDVDTAYPAGTYTDTLTFTVSTK